MEAEEAEWARLQELTGHVLVPDFMPAPESEDVYDEDELDDEDDLDDEDVDFDKKPEMTEDEKKEKRTEDIKKTFTKLEVLFGEVYACKDKADGIEMATTMGSMAKLIVDEMICVAEEWNILGECKDTVEKLKETIDRYL